MKLFVSRLVLYLTAVAFPVFYPGIVVSYDPMGLKTWFGLIPLMMCLAFFLRPPRFHILTGPLSALGVLLAYSFFITGWNLDGFFYVSVGLGAYILTLLVFSGSTRGIALAVLELFALSAIYFKLLDYARSSEYAFQMSQSWVIPILVTAILAFLIHAMVIYLAAFPDRAQGRRRREVLLFLGIGLPLCFLAAVVLPSDFVKNEIVLNELFDEKKTESLDTDDGFDKDKGGGGDEEEKKKSDENEGKPLGDKKFPTPKENGGDKDKENEVKKTLPDEHRTGDGKSKKGEGDKGKGDKKKDEGKDSKNKGKEPKPKEDQQKKDGKKTKEEEKKKNGGSAGGKPENQKKKEGGSGQGEQKDQPSGGQGENQQKQKDQKGGGKSKDKKKDQELKGVPSDQWNNQVPPSGGTGPAPQMAVMVIASPVDPVYAAESYWTKLHPTKGLLIEPEFDLNRLRSARLLETWKNPKVNTDEKREKKKVFYFSTIPNRVLAYWPETVEPTRQDVKYFPFTLSYNAESHFSFTGKEDWEKIEGLSVKERKELKAYLEVPLKGKSRRVFKRYLKKTLKGKKGYFERIQAIIESYKRYQYKLGRDEDTSMGKLTRFIQKGKDGDCTEFSHTAAILGRMAGIPSRVATGFLAARGLQTPAHRAGLRRLRKDIEPLQKYPMDELYLVTNMHGHAWVQYYLPGYGWVDFEATSFAKKPSDAGNPNSRDVVIPLIEKKKNEAKARAMAGRKFPWKVVGYALAAFLLAVLIGLYFYRYIREIFLYFRSRGRSIRALRAAETLVLMRMAANGYVLKERHETMLDYSRRYEVLQRLTPLRNMLHYRMSYGPGEKEAAWAEFTQLFRDTRSRLKRSGFLNFLRRVFSLKGLYY